MTLSDLYGQLFGKSSIQDGDVISMAEHGRIGGISTGQGFKYVGILNASGSIVSEFGGTGSALATVTAVQGPAGTVPWLMTLATLSVVTQPGAGALATVTAQQGSAGVSPWLVTMGTLSVTQAGIWSVNALASIPGTSNINIASSDIPLGGGTQYNNGDSAGVPIGNVMMWRQSGDNTVQSAADDNPLPVAISTSLTIQSLPTLSVLQGTTPWNTINAGGSLTAYQGSAPWTVLATISNNINVLNAGGSLTSYQGGSPWNVLATVSNTLTIQTLPTLSVFQGTNPWNVSNAGGSLTAYQGSAPWSVLATISNSVTALNAGGSLTAYQGSAPWSVMATISNNVNTLNAGGSLTAYQGASPWTVQDLPVTTGGLSKFHLVSAATDNATNIKASAGQVYAISAFNLNASARYLKFHNTSGTPTAGTGVTDTYLIPGNTAGAGVVFNIDKGIAFGTGIGITMVTGIADNNATAVAASEIVVNIYYK